MKLREIVRKVKEGPLPPPDKGVNDARPGLPTPSPRIDTFPNIAQGKTATYAPVTLPQQLSPDTTWSRAGGVTVQTGPTGKPYAVGGASPTSTPGYGKLSPSGAGLTDQHSVGGRPSAKGPGTSTVASPGKVPQLGSSTTVTPGFAKLTPSGTGIRGERRRRG